MIAALALPSKAHDLLTILSEGMLIFLLCLIGSMYPWLFGRPISTKRYLAICGLFTAIWVLVGAFFATKG